MTTANEFLRPHREHFAEREYATAALAAYIASVVQLSSKVMADWEAPAEFLEGMLQVSYRDARSYSSHDLMPGENCCGEFMGLQVAFFETTDADRRAKHLVAGQAWFARHSDCSQYQRMAAAFRAMKEEQASWFAAAALARQRERERAEQAHAKHEAEESAKRHRALEKAKREAAKRTEDIRSSADALVNAVMATAQDRKHRLQFTHMDKLIELSLHPPCMPELALISAARQVRTIANLTDEDRLILFNRLIQAAEQRVAR